MFRLFVAFFFLVLSFALVSPLKAQSTSTLESVTLQLKYQHNFQFAGYYAAKAKGYYQDAGLDVTITPAKIGTSASDAVLSGEANYGIGTSSLLLKHSRGMPLVPLAVIFQYSPFTLITSQHTRLPDIKGSEVVISKNAHDIIAMLDNQGVSASSYINNKQRFRLSDLIDSRIKAISGYSTNEPAKLNALGFKFNTFSPRDYGVNFYGDNVFTSHRELENYPERTQRFIKASLKGWEYALNNQLEIAQLLLTRYHSKESLEHILFAAKEVEFLIQPRLLNIGISNSNRWRHIADTYAQLGLLPADYDLDSFLLNHKEEKSQRQFSNRLLFFTAALFVITLMFRVFALLRDKRRATREMRFMNSILRTQQQASIDGILTFDANGLLVSCNKQIIELWNLKQKNFGPKDSKQIVYQMLRQLKEPREFISIMRQHASNPKMESFAEMTLRDGRTFERFSAPLFHDDKSFLGRFWSFRDITERKLAQEQIWLKANFDSLTELPNRFMFKERLQFEIKKARRTNKLVALLFLDIDHFKEINDSMGHDVGDQLLIQVANRLKQCVRDIDMVSRLGGDEFTVILSGLEKATDIERVAQNILTMISTPFEIEQQTIYISTSIGVTFSPTDSEDDIELLKNADLAMYDAKSKGRNNYQLFSSSLQVNSIAKIALTNDLRHALDNQELFLAYQPIVCLQSKKVIKAEALIRWRHPQHGLINPAEFISIAEETGLINKIGDWVFKQAVQQVKLWREIDPKFQISINTSPIQFQSGSINPSDWHEYLSKHQVSAKAVIIELTETLLLESNTSLLTTLKEFRAQGTPISLDDFGTGYSSLSYLKKFEIDFLKIDQSFVNDLSQDSKEAILCQAIISMANSLGMKVVAEGIETIEHNHLLTDLGCEFGQGYLFSKPIDADQFQAFLNDEHQLLCHQ